MIPVNLYELLRCARSSLHNSTVTLIYKSNSLFFMRDHEYHRIFSCQTLIVNQTKSLGLHITSRVSVWSEALQKRTKCLSYPFKYQGLSQHWGAGKSIRLAKSIMVLALPRKPLCGPLDRLDTSSTLKTDHTLKKTEYEKFFMPSITALNNSVYRKS